MINFVWFIVFCLSICLVASAFIQNLTKPPADLEKDEQ